MCYFSNEEKRKIQKGRFEENDLERIADLTYFYISPRSFLRDGMDWRNETFREYAKRTHYAWNLFRKIFSSKKYTDRRLNYSINN